MRLEPGQEEIEAQFQVGNRFFDLPAGDKQPWKFESDLFAGWRSLEDTSKAVGEPTTVIVVT